MMHLEDQIVRRLYTLIDEIKPYIKEQKILNREKLKDIAQKVQEVVTLINTFQAKYPQMSSKLEPKVQALMEDLTKISTRTNVLGIEDMFQKALNKKRDQ